MFWHVPCWQEKIKKNIIRKNIKNVDFLKMTIVPFFSVNRIRECTLQIEILEILHLKFSLYNCQWFVTYFPKEKSGLHCHEKKLKETK